MRALAAAVAVLAGLAAGTWGATGYLWAARPGRHAVVVHVTDRGRLL